MASSSRVLINNTVSNRRHKTEAYSTFYIEPQGTTSPQVVSREYTHHTQRPRPKPQVIQPNPPRIQRSNTLPTATMCEKHSYYADKGGAAVKQTRTEFCHEARRRGSACEHPIKYRHPKEERSPPLTGVHYTHNNLPPSPPSSDASFPPSGSEAERARKRRSGIYINGERVLDINRKPSRRERRNSNHVVIVEPPVSPRASPRYVTPVSSPPSGPGYLYEPRSHHYPSHSRPEVMLEVSDHRQHRKSDDYHRHTPRTHRESHSSGSISDEERIRKLERELKKTQEAVRLQRLQSEIERQNEAIANRPAVPSAPQPMKVKYRRGSVSIKQPGESLAEAMRKVQLRDAAAAEAEKERIRRDKRSQEKREREEAEAQRRRLLARMAPQPTVTASARRQSKVYEDPFYIRTQPR